MLQEITQTVTSPEVDSKIQGLITSLVGRLQEGTEIFSVAIIGIGIVIAAYHIVRLLVAGRRRSQRENHLAYQEARLNLSRFLAVALEFQLAADLLGTTVAPTWDRLGRLGAIAAIRTFLNYFLAREIREEEKGEQEVRNASATIVRKGEA